MTFRPKNKTNKETALSITMAIFAIILFLLSGIVSKFIIVYQISALIFALVSVEMYTKYIGSDYIYEAAEKSFKVHKVTGKKSICVCSLDYELSLSRVIAGREWLIGKDSYPKSNFTVNYCKNLSPKEYFVYFFEFNGKVSMMKFEPDDVFVNYVNELIDRAVSGKQENN